MAKSSHSQPLPLPGTLPLWKTALWAAIALSGLAAVMVFLRVPSEKESSFLLGYSLIRLVMAGGMLAAVATFALFSLAEYLQFGWWKRLDGFATRFLASPARLFALLAFFFAVFLSEAALLILSISPAASELVILKTIRSHLGIQMLWSEIAIVLVCLLITLTSDFHGRWPTFFSPLRLAILFLIVTAVYALALRVFMHYTWDVRMRDMENYLYGPVIVLLVWGWLHHQYRTQAWYARASQALQLLAIGVVTYVIYRHSAQWMEWQNTPSKAYWPELAEAFLQGRLYLINPGTTHDLTLYQGNWYVPNPPLPALVLLPFIAIGGIAGINTVTFSMAIGAVNVILLFLILAQAARLKMIPTTRSGNLLVIAVLAFATPHWWLSILGRMWFMSQILTLTFTALAVLLTLRKGSPWWVGLCLGLAMLSRPNAFTLWPFLAGLMLFLHQQAYEGKIHWKWAFGWSVQSALPVCLAVGAQLYYNYIRFGSWFDFGYVTINSAGWLMDSVKTYGMFNAHFIPANLNMMFFKPPTLEMHGSCLYFSPSREGFSMLAVTPALIYLFRRFHWQWWSAGAWLSILLSLGLLMFYHNNGAWQLGYRYVLDFILPVLLLLAVGIGQRPSWVFKGLLALSILINAAGIIWWFEKWWC